MNLLKITDFNKNKIKDILSKSKELKKQKKEKIKHKELKDKNIGLFFEEPSTRTRISFSVAINDLGSNSIFMDQKQLQLSRGEGLKDTAEVFSRYLDAVAIRTLSHEKIKKLAQNSTIPIINAMTKKHHPCQSLADLLTIKEKKGNLEELEFTWIGDGNNVCHSAILANSIMGIKTNVATPRSYEPNKEVIKEAKKIGGEIELFNEPKRALKDSDIIYTDVWVSTGDKNPEQKKKDFKGFKITKELLKQTKDDSIVMHCMPIKGNEIERKIVEGKKSVIYDQAENRLHTQKALLTKLMDQE